jgi:hypothetical protein
MLCPYDFEGPVAAAAPSGAHSALETPSSWRHSHSASLIGESSEKHQPMAYCLGTH